MRLRLYLAIFFVAMLALSSCGGSSQTEPAALPAADSPTPVSPTAAPEPTPVPEPTATAVPQPTATAVPSPTPEPPTPAPTEDTTDDDLQLDLSNPPSAADVSPIIQKGGCIACHTIAGIDGAVGVLGPAWCDVAEEFEDGEIDLAFIYESIVSPNAEVEDGFPANVMPQNFGEVLTQDELNSLVVFIATLNCE